MEEEVEKEVGVFVVVGVPKMAVVDMVVVVVDMGVVVVDMGMVVVEEVVVDKILVHVVQYSLYDPALHHLLQLMFPMVVAYKRLLLIHEKYVQGYSPVVVF